MTIDKDRFYRVISAMEEEDQESALSPATEDKLVHGVLAELSAQRRRRRQRTSLISALAMAACLAILFTMRGTQAPLPHYALNIPSDDRVLGSAAPAGEKTQLAEDSILSIELTPHDPVVGEVKVDSFVRQGPDLHPWQPQLARTKQGVFQLRAAVHELPDLHAGSFELVFAVGRGSNRPTVTQLTEALRREPPTVVNGWQVLHRAVEIVAH